MRLELMLPAVPPLRLPRRGRSGQCVQRQAVWEETEWLLQFIAKRIKPEEGVSHCDSYEWRRPAKGGDHGYWQKYAEEIRRSVQQKSIGERNGRVSYALTSSLDGPELLDSSIKKLNVYIG